MNTYGIERTVLLRAASKAIFPFKKFRRRLGNMAPLATPLLGMYQETGLSAELTPDTNLRQETTWDMEGTERELRENREGKETRSVVALLSPLQPC